MKTVAYISSATKEQVEYKRNIIMEYANQREIELSSINVDVGSRLGGIGFELTLLIASARDGKFDTLLIPTISCISRDMHSASKVIRELIDYGIRIISVGDNLDTEDKGIKFGFTILSEFVKLWENDGK